MPDVSIAISAQDSYSSAIKSMAQITKSFSKDMDEMEETLHKLNTNKYSLKLDADAALLARAVENLLHNAACHNPGPVQVQLSAVRTGKTLRITIADDGAGYPLAVLHALQTGEAGENTPHILGLHVVEQIIHAHGGTAAFARNAPRGAKAVLVLPVTEDPAAR